MNKALIFAGAVAALALTSAPASAAPVPATTNATATARIYTPLTLTSVRDLDLGTIVLGAGADTDTVGIDQAGTFGGCVNVTCSGGRSTFGEVRVLKQGVKDPIARQRAVAVYTEVGQRQDVLPIDESFKGEVAGPVTVQYVETYDDGSRTIAETQAVLR